MGVIMIILQIILGIVFIITGSKIVSGAMIKNSSEWVIQEYLIR
ncbi:hypothetical protein DOD24_0751 [Staphylococcus arlettae]|nr:hypothetical protein DOD23_0793 [Staphylococcus arlettae]RBA05298.1 hypothetical protein DOD22_0779 [Staphylococcus arlettae]RBA07696.1 hypothetical protein DOD24_0751 [Staphylococcus arlettae]